MGLSTLRFFVESSDNSRRDMLRLVSVEIYLGPVWLFVEIPDDTKYHITGKCVFAVGRRVFERREFRVRVSELRIFFFRSGKIS